LGRSAITSRSTRAFALAVLALVVTCCNPSSSTGSATPQPPEGIHKIQHIVIVMQENRSFDNYFGTFPGADGIPRDQSGRFAVCSPDPATGACIAPFHDSNNLDTDAPHAAEAARADVDGGKMDGFVAEAEQHKLPCNSNVDPNCSTANRGDVMGFHDAREIPNYWRYAKDFVPQDHMFEPNASWSLPAHLFLVSEWSAKCSTGDPESCTNALDLPDRQDPVLPGKPAPNYAWTDLTYLLHKADVSWKYYVEDGLQPDCTDGDLPCVPQPQNPRTPEIWNPLPYFETVQQDGQVGNIQGLESFYNDLATNQLPAVSWIVLTWRQSEHAPGLLSDGQAHVTKVVNSIMQSAAWSSTAIFVSWDDWGGWYDHVVPPSVDENGYGLRVPGLVISPYARKGFIDHQTLSFDAYVKFIEYVFLGGQRLDPATDGRPDPRPTVREDASILGDLSKDFNFSQSPRPPEVLPLYPAFPKTSTE